MIQKHSHIGSILDATNWLSTTSVFHNLSFLFFFLILTVTTHERNATPSSHQASPPSHKHIRIYIYILRSTKAQKACMYVNTYCTYLGLGY